MSEYSSARQKDAVEMAMIGVRDLICSWPLLERRAVFMIFPQAWAICEALRGLA